jgi:hypothetical protein
MTLIYKGVNTSSPIYFHIKHHYLADKISDDGVGDIRRNAGNSFNTDRVNRRRKYRRIQSSPSILYTLPNTITLNHRPAATITFLHLPKNQSMQTFALANNSHPVFWYFRFCGCGSTWSCGWLSTFRKNTRP